MKKVLFLMAIIFTYGAALATTQCISWPQSNASSMDYTYNESEWSVTWANGFVAKGVAVCASKTHAQAEITSLSTRYPATSKITYVNNGGSDNNCYCKMTYPAISAWTWNNKDYDAAGCVQKCAFHCADGLRGYPVWRTAVFGTVSMQY